MNYPVEHERKEKIQSLSNMIGLYVNTMKEINLGRILIENRHKRGITQDELAAHIGVSKGAVSKWETGVSLR